MASYRNMTSSFVDIYMNKYKTVCSDKFIRISYFSTQRYCNIFNYQACLYTTNNI